MVVLTCSYDAEHMLLEGQVGFPSEMIRIGAEGAQEVIDVLFSFDRCAGAANFRLAGWIPFRTHSTSPGIAGFLRIRRLRSLRTARELKSVAFFRGSGVSEEYFLTSLL